MNIEGRALLQRFGFSAPVRNQVLSYDAVSRLDVDALYTGNRCGVSIEVAPQEMKLSHGPNWFPKFRSAHNVPRSSFSDSFEHVVADASALGFSPSSLRFAFCHSVPHDVTISGICARVEESSVGYLVCDALNSVRKGDFTPDHSIRFDIVGGRPMGHTKQITVGSSPLPSWATEKLYGIMRRVNRFQEGLVGVEFVLDRFTHDVIFHDLYWALHPYDSLREKFGLFR